MDEWLRDLAAVAAGAEERAFNQDAVPALRTMVEKTGIQAADVAMALAAVERARELARGNVHPQLLVSGLVRDLRAACRPPRRPEYAS